MDGYFSHLHPHPLNVSCNACPTIFGLIDHLPATLSVPLFFLCTSCEEICVTFLCLPLGRLYKIGPTRGRTSGIGMAASLGSLREGLTFWFHLGRLHWAIRRCKKKIFKKEINVNTFRSYVMKVILRYYYFLELPGKLV